MRRRPDWRLGRLVLALVTAGLPASLPSRADLLALGPPAPVLHAGAEVTLPLPGLPPGADEAEVYLSLDAGRSFPVRVTEERDPRGGSLSFRIPNLASGSAWLLVRAGGRRDGRRYETDLVSSGPFRLTPASGAAAPVPWADRGLLRRRADHARVEWRAEERSVLLARPLDPAPPGVAPAGTSLAAGRAAEPPLLLAGRTEVPAPAPFSSPEGPGGERRRPLDPGSPAGVARRAVPGPLRL